jgi:hypothetical protein
MELMMLKTIDLSTTTLTLDELLEQLQTHDEIILMRANQKIARIASEQDVSAWLTKPPKQRQFGLSKGTFSMSDDFNDELPDAFWLGEDE